MGYIKTNKRLNARGYPLRTFQEINITRNLGNKNKVNIFNTNNKKRERINSFKENCPVCEIRKTHCIY